MPSTTNSHVAPHPPGRPLGRPAAVFRLLRQPSADSRFRATAGQRPAGPTSGNPNVLSDGSRGSAYDRVPNGGETHDPGPEVAVRARAGRARRGGRADRAARVARHVRVGTASWTDPTMTAGTVFYPRRRRLAPRSGCSTTPASSRWSRSTPPTTRCPSERTAELWRDRTPPDFVFDIKAPRPDDRPADRDQAPAQVDPRGAAGRARGEAAHLRARPARRAARRGLADVPGGPGAAARDRPAGLDPAAVPALVLSHSARAATRSSARASGWATTRSPSSCATASWFNEKNVDRTMRFLTDNKLPFVMVDEPQGFKSSVPPVVAVTSPELAVMRFHGRRNGDMGGEGHHAGRALPLPVRPRRARRLGAQAARRRASRRATCTC